MINFIHAITEKILSGKEISKEEALKLLCVNDKELYYLFASANYLRMHFRGRRVDLCAITNAKSGLCPEDCAFCAQSAHHATKAAVYPLIPEEEILRRAEKAKVQGTQRFCIVTSGRQVTPQEFKKICRTVTLIKNKFPSLHMDASLGQLDKDMAGGLKEAGLQRYNHNVETCQEFFPRICTTHSYSDRLKTIALLKEAGLEVCCGGIFGLGESVEQRIDFAFELKALDVDCIPLNFLNPVPCTPLESNPDVPALELLKTVAILRHILPKKQIRICGGREKNLRSLQAMIFLAGSDSIIIGEYLTTLGACGEDDLKMITDLGLNV